MLAHHLLATLTVLTSTSLTARPPAAPSPYARFPAPQTETDKPPVLESKLAPRRRHRITYFGQNRKRPSPGQITAECGALKFETGIENGTRRWRAGADYWSTLDVNCNIQFGGKAIAPGHYYVMVDRKGADWNLVLLDSKPVRKKQKSFAYASKIKGGIVIPLTREPVSGKPRNLAMTFRHTDRRNAPEKLRFNLDWGPHRYAADLKMKSLGKVTPFTTVENRSRAILQATGDPAKGTAFVAAIEHATPEWKPSRETMLRDLKPGNRWRMGVNFWSSLETNVPVTIGKTKLLPGYYFLMLERGRGDKWSLVVLASKVAIKKTMDAFQSRTSKGGKKIPLETEAALEKVQEKLSVTMDTGESEAQGSPNSAKLHIRWGRFHLSAPVIVHVPTK